MTGAVKADEFIRVVHDQPLWAVREAVRRIFAGLTPFGRPFGPGPVEFADLVRDVTKPYRDDLVTLKDIGNAAIGFDISPEERARVAEGFAGLKAELGGVKSELRKKHEAEEGLRKRAAEMGIDYAETMSSLPDASVRKGEAA